jgi:hypothetical protein
MDRHRYAYTGTGTSADEKVHLFVYRLCHQNDSQLLPLRTKQGMGNRETRTALMGTGNWGISGKWGRNLNSLEVHLQAGKERIRKSPIEFVPVLEKAKGIRNRRI